jgi:hypothetical protein
MHRNQNGHLRLAARAADYHPGRRSAPAGPIPSNLAAQAMTDLAKRASLGVREFQSTFQLGLHDAVFGGQIFVPRQQLLARMRVQSITAPLPRPSARSSLIVPKSYWTAYGTAMPTLASRPFQFFDGVDAPSDGIEVCHAGDVA